jgi:hypothetical protein
MKSDRGFIVTKTWSDRIGILAILTGLLAACSPAPNNPDVVVVNPNTPAVTPTASGVVIQEPITDVVVITTYPNKESLVNKRVLFTETQVLNVVGDRPFWVGRSNNERLAVVLAPALDKGSAEKKIVVRAGQTLDLAGVLKPMPSAETARQQWGLNATEAQQLQSEVVYLQADKIDFK